MVFKPVNPFYHLIQTFPLSRTFPRFLPLHVSSLTHLTLRSPFSSLPSHNLEKVNKFVSIFHFNRSCIVDTPELTSLGSQLTTDVVVTALRSFKNWRTAFRFFTWASNQSGYRHTCYTYNAMASILSDARANTAMKALYVDMVNSRCYVSAGALGFSVWCLGRLRMVTEANELFDQVKNLGCVPNNYSYNSLLGAISMSGSVELMALRMNEMKANGWNPDKYTFTAVLRCCCRAGRFEKALEVFQQMEKRGWVDSYVFTILLISLTKAGEVYEVIHLINKMDDFKVSLNEKTFDVLIHGFLKDGKVDYALSLLKKMQSSGFVPGISLYSGLIEWLRKNKEFTKAFELYSQMNDLYRSSGLVDERLIYQAALQDLNQPLTEENLPDGLLTVSLLRHQKIALAWMVQKEMSVACSGGILADDQGLGKTISMIALIQNQRFSSKPQSDDSSNKKAEALNLDDDGKAAIVLDEDREAGENDALKVITDASSSTQRFSNRKLAAGSLVVCPASVLRQWARELDEKVSEEAKLEVLVYHGGNRTKDPAELARYDVVLTTYAVVAKEVPTRVFDEEDDDDQRNEDRFGLTSEFGNNKKRKGGVSGNQKKGKKGLDGCSGTLAKVNWFRVILDEAQTIKNSRTQVAKACCGLEAKKRWCLSGTPIQNSIDETFSYFRFLKCDPYADYNSFCSQIKLPISKNSHLGYRKLQAVLKAIMLRRTKGTLIDGKPIINLPEKTIKLTMVDFSTEERAFYRNLETESCLRFKAYETAGTVSQNYANILLLLLRLRQACDHPLLVMGFSSESASKLSTKMARNLPNNMRANLLNLLETPNICHLCSDPPEDAVVTLCGHVFCYQCVSEYLTGDDTTCPTPKCKRPIGPDRVFNKATLRNSMSDDSSTSSSRIDEKSIVLQQDYSSSKIKAALDIILSNCRTRSSNSEAPGLVRCNGEALGVEGPIKAIVFSQWTRMLDLVEMSLNQYYIGYRRLDGSMPLASRDRAVKEFNTDPEVIVMLMSLKARNLGLNMVAASHVILLDLWWNPTTEDQAIDRAHRIGQTRPVTVSRLTIKDTVEDRILALQEEKRKMVASAFGEDQSGTSTARLTAEDLKYLFMGAY